MVLRRDVLTVTAASLVGCATRVSLEEAPPPIVFVHGNGDTAAFWQTTLWRFESNGWPRERLYAPELPFPLARDDDTRAQAGRSSTAEHMAFLKAEVDKVLRATGGRQVVLVGASRGGNAIRNYIHNGGGDSTVSHAVLCGVSSHGVWAVPIDGLPNGSEFAGHGVFLQSLNRPRNAAGDEVIGPTRWLTIRSDRNDKYAQPDGLWVGKRGVATGVSFDGPALRGASNVVIPRIDHRETATSVPAFDAMYRFITGRAPATTSVTPESRVVLSGNVTGLGVSPADPASGNFGNNLPLMGARLEIFEIDPILGERRGAAVYGKAIEADGRWGPFTARVDARYEFVVSAPGYAIAHIYRSPFPRSSAIVNLRARRIAEVDRYAPAIVTLHRPRGYLDPGRDKMAVDGISPPPGAVLGAGVDSSTIKPTGLPRAVVAEFNGERLIGRSWPAAQNHVSILELSY